MGLIVKGKRREVGKTYYFTYYDVEYDDEGWVDPTLYSPLPCDMVTIKVRSKKSGKVKQVNGWWTGDAWDGLNLRPTDEIIGWCLNEYSETTLEMKDLPVTKKKMKTLIINKAERWLAPKRGRPSKYKKMVA